MKTTYWITTSLVSAMLLLSAVSYMFHKPTIEGVKALGFPDFFRVQLIILKLIAVVILLLPFFPVYVKDWAYAGAACFFITAIVAHFVHEDPVFINIINFVMIILLVISNYYMRKLI